MGVLERFSRFVGGGARDPRDELRTCYVGCIGRAAQLRRHADMAPQAYSIEGLQQLAAEEEQQAERLRNALRADGQMVPTISSQPLPPGALNHWSRLVQDLEAHRQSARRLRELAIHFAEAMPSTATLFDDLCREEMVHCERLRALIARADPQALD